MHLLGDCASSSQAESGEEIETPPTVAVCFLWECVGTAQYEMKNTLPIIPWRWPDARACVHVCVCVC